MKNFHSFIFSLLSIFVCLFLYHDIGSCQDTVLVFDDNFENYPNWIYTSNADFPSFSMPTWSYGDNKSFPYPIYYHHNHYVQIQNGILYGVSSGYYSDPDIPDASIDKEIDLDGSEGFIVEFRALSASSWPNRAAILIFSDYDANSETNLSNNVKGYEFNIYGESSTYAIDLRKYPQPPNDWTNYRLYVGSGLLENWHTYDWVKVYKISTITDVQIDIKPGSYPNSINCQNQNGVIPVAILTNPEFDAKTVDHTTVRFGPSEAKETHCIGGNGGKGNRSGSTADCPLKRHEEDVDGDGDIDLVFHFKHSETGLTCNDTIGVLTGKTSSSQDIVGSDIIRPVRSENQFEIPVNIEPVPNIYSLAENYPNPFNPSTSIRYSVPSRSRVKLEIFNTLGQKVVTLVDAEKEAGYYYVEWNANVSSGMYFYRLYAIGVSAKETADKSASGGEAVDVSNPTNRFVETKKMLLLK
ncbi:MAG: T9SS type A sorting domain-containing protein [Ignavibacteriales bacterium]|nr:T9SS type A sorting domain-containing protein [Ignavibacteriales bacterium]